MSIIGIDFGTSGCVVATIKRGAVSVVRNDLSERLTPSLIGFTKKERNIGEAAQTYIKSNFKNTCRYFKYLMGLTREDEKYITYEEQFALAPLDYTQDNEGSLIGYNVLYKGEQQIFTATRCLAALLTSLKAMAEKSTGAPIQSVVISVPGWYTDRARQAVLDAAEIAGLHCLRAMNEHAAIALDYGIYRSSSFDAEKTLRVAFIGMGHGSTLMTVVHYTRGQLRVVLSATDRFLGGRNIDQLLMQHLAQKFYQQHRINPLENAKARLKLEETATRLKKILSANTESAYNIECLVEDYELSGCLTRQEFEQLCSPLREQLLNFLKTTLDTHGLSVGDIEHLEIVGGCCRTPFIQSTLLEFFNHQLTLSRTLSMDETIARGCALQAAMLDPRYKVREFNVYDTISEPITVSYQSTSHNSESELKTGILFEKGSVLGSKKWLTFARSANFDIQLTSKIQTPPLIVHVQLPEEGLNNDYTKKVKVGVRLTLHGTILCDTAQLLVDEEIVEEQQVQTDGNTNEAATTTAAAPPVTTPRDESMPEPASEKKSEGDKKKIKTRRYDCTLISKTRVGYIDQQCKTTLRQSELAMCEDDLSQSLLRERMNDLETYIYKMQGLLLADLKDFSTSEEQTNALEGFKNAYHWIYDIVDETATREDYEKQLQILQQLCEPITKRQNDYNERQVALQDLSNVLNELRSTILPEKLKFDWNHVPTEKMNSLITKINETERWLDHVSEISKSTPLNENCSITPISIRQEKDMLINFSKTVLIPKPVVEQPPNNNNVKASMNENNEQSQDYASTQSANDQSTFVPLDKSDNQNLADDSTYNSNMMTANDSTMN